MKLNKRIEAEIENGIPVTHAKFHQAVDNLNNVPSSDFNLNSNNVERRIEMHLTDMGLICLQNGQYFIVFKSNIISVR